MLIHDNPFKQVGHIEDTRPILYTVMVNFPCHRRIKPRLQATAVGTISNGIRCNIYAEKDGWGQLEDGSWITLGYTTRI